MTNFRESWKRSEAHLRRAHERAGSPTLDAFRDYLDHNELELAGDVLAGFGDPPLRLRLSGLLRLMDKLQGLHKLGVTSHLNAFTDDEATP